MKILQVNKYYYPWLGGVETIVRQLGEGVNDGSDFISEVLCCNNKFTREKVKINGVKVCRARRLFALFSMPLSIDFFYQFKKKAKDFDIIDIHHPFPLALLAYLIFRPKAKLVVHYHSDIFRQRVLGFFLGPVIRKVLFLADVVIVSSPNLIASSKVLKPIKSKCRVINFGVDLNEIDELVANSEKEVEQIKNEFGNFVLYVGRLSYYKGLEYLLKSCQDLDLNLVMIGQGKEQTKLHELAKELSMEEKVFFLPHVSEQKKFSFYSAAKIFVLPSIYRSEAFGLVLMEAMAVGTPVISTELGTGTSYINKHNVTGVVVEPKDSNKLREEIDRILSNDKMLISMGQAAQRRIREEFTLEKMISNFKKEIS